MRASDPLHRRPRAGARLAAMAVALAAAAAPFAARPDSPLGGFSAAGSAREASLEGRFDTLLSAADLREWMAHLAAEPNHVGSPHDRSNAEYVAALARSWGWTTRIA